MNAEQLQDSWMATNNSVAISSYIERIRLVATERTEFLVILYRDNEAGDNRRPIGSIGSLNVFSRRRIRTPYHVTLRSVDEPQIRPGKRFSEWHWQFSPQNLEDAIAFACSTQFVVTFSTVKSGASVPLNVHFQGVPRIMEWNGLRHELFGSLLGSRELDFGRQKGDSLRVSIQDYPAFVARIAGRPRDVCEKVLTLCVGYDGLQSFNLIIESLGNESQDQKEVAVYWFPRRLDGRVMSKRYEHYRWAFGSFEMAGVFLTAHADIYDGLTASDLSDALKEVSIQEQSHEHKIVTNLLRYP